MKKYTTHPFSGNKVQNVIFFTLAIVGAIVCRTDLLARLHEQAHVNYFDGKYRAEIIDNTHTRVYGFNKSDVKIPDMLSGYWGEFLFMVFCLCVGLGISNTQRPGIRNNYWFMGFFWGYMWSLIPYAVKGKDFTMNIDLSNQAIQSWFILTIPTAILITFYVFICRILLIGKLRD